MRPTAWKGFATAIRWRVKKRAHYMMLQVAKRYPVAAELIVKCATGSTNIYKQHIMQALMECGFSRDIYGEMYHKLFDKDSPESVLVTPKYPDIEEVLTAIHDAGGIAVLAHPYFFDNLDSLPRLIENGLDGIEIWHPCATEEQQAELKKIATKNKLLMTGGTDFHGLYNLDPVSIGDVLTPDRRDGKTARLQSEAKNVWHAKRQKQRRPHSFKTTPANNGGTTEWKTAILKSSAKSKIPATTN